MACCIQMSVLRHIALCPIPGSLGQERCGVLGMGPVEGNKDNERTGACLICGKAAGAGDVQLFQSTICMFNSK